MARTILIESGLPESFWAEAIRTSVYLVNRLPSKANPADTLSAYEAYFGKPPELGHLHPFGCAAYAQIPCELRQKRLSQPKSRPGIFIGYVEETTHQYRIYDPSRKTMIIERDVIFDDSLFPASKADQTLNGVEGESIERNPVKLPATEPAPVLAPLAPKSHAENPAHTELSPSIPSPKTLWPVPATSVKETDETAQNEQISEVSEMDYSDEDAEMADRNAEMADRYSRQTWQESVPDGRQKCVPKCRS